MRSKTHDSTHLLRLLSKIGVLVGVVAALLYAMRWRKNPSPCPYSQRYWLQLPRPILTQSRLRDILVPQAGERVLEIGPGTGYYTLAVARWLEPSGMLHVLDIQQEMLDQTLERACAQGSENVEATQGDAQTLPYPNNHFDAAYLTIVLGEIPDQEQTLGELNRVLKPGGRLIVGELLPDPHFVTFETLCARAERQGFEFTTRVGGKFGYFARFQSST